MTIEAAMGEAGVLHDRVEADAVEAFLRDADNGDRVVIQADGLAQDFGVATETRLPVRIAQNGVRVRAGVQIVIRGDRREDLEGRILPHQVACSLRLYFC